MTFRKFFIEMAGKIWTLAITELALINHSLYNLPLEMLFFT